jgi:hypothetical protein
MSVVSGLTGMRSTRKSVEYNYFRPGGRFAIHYLSVSKRVSVLDRHGVIPRDHSSCIVSEERASKFYVHRRWVWRKARRE